MSGLPPARRLRTKTSDLTDFFRGSGNSSTQPRQTQKDITTSMNLEVPSCDETASVKKKITRIPLFGRSRKRSNQSSSSSPFTSYVRESSDLGESSTASRAPSTDTRRPSVPSIAHVPVPPLPTSRVPTPSLSSKLAAHFSHSRSSKQISTTQASSTPAQPPAVSSGLKPPSTRSASFESGSSAGTKRRSTTPRPSQPLITVSLSPDEQFMDLFTRPKRKPSQSAEKTKRSSSAVDSDITPNGSPASSPRTRSPEQSIYRRGYTPASAIAAAVRHRQNSSIGSDQAPSTSSKTSNSRKNSDSDKSNEKDEGSSTPRLSEPRESPRPSLPDKEKGLPPSLQRRPSVATGPNHQSDNGSSTARSRMKQPSIPARSRPPSMPLPLPPTPIPSSASYSSFPGFQGTQTTKRESTSAKTVVRPRAHTIGAVVSLSTPLEPLSRPAENKQTTPTISSTHTTPTISDIPHKADGEMLDIENASAEDLREALKLRNLQYDELASFILKMTESHVAEVTALEKKISVLTKDALKREKQIKGFTLLLSDEESSRYPKPLPPGILNQSRFASSAETDPDRTSIPRKFSYQSDSGAESHATSGAESLRASGASGSESMSSMMRNKRLRRPYPLGDQAYAASRTGTALRTSRLPPGVVSSDKGSPDIPHLNPKRSSVSSISGSPSSSTSSLLPPSPSITMSSLSAIPEGPTATLRLPRYDSSDQQEERRALRASHRTSTSSLTSSSTAASSSYSANIKRSRPPSIAQVLEKSPNMDDVLEKLRPFS
ncbi:hypothetical protein M413DRAFT_27901 [Hebeloma cylindrosporum]|uniref:Uncharacterized protein n=1 Tax=Hebeloma cylindrosporum TaxID=76867 RepID=A0A0C3BYD8_HEBCY|nr:hypothetical protein M413DRAFT_27901 [Hebeloma cylindrosporum h7]